MFVQKIIFRLSAFYAFGIGLFAVVPSASAFTFSPSGDSVTITAADINKSFNIDFNGNVSTQNVQGLSSTAIFKFLGFNTVGSGANTRTEAAFNIDLTNTSSNGITSRTSVLGFNTSLPLRGVGSTNTSGNTRTSGLFNQDRTGQLPNQFGNLDVCFLNRNGNGGNCSGGGNGGVSTGDPTGTFSPILAFNGNINTFTLSNFGVRYQSITGTGLGTSGTGRGFYTPPPPPPRRVSEPATVAAISLFVLGGLQLKKKQRLLSV
ncbi:cistern family PEP-CTERM protein [Nostoc sp. TCL26-01]|uniref:cistern family PEP-CTERM protein n=1 Tax=Nostoc sp. TCL26-01 TaxID=2576904 RepID=UPI0015BDB69F|nr:cistern family PEP-CTERM protein [Nostoc sp. TCL26-01]QLE54373.1 PEP-CTERM sorting domain-containing protein [Nostoc sp. TCL26-01]